jgi:hypothetical protein
VGGAGSRRRSITLQVVGVLVCHPARSARRRLPGC